MRFSFAAESLIAAPQSVVWHVLTDRQTLLEGDFGLLSLEGDLKAGGRLNLRAAIAPKQSFKLNVSVFEPDHLMVWTGGMPFGLFTGTRRFSLTPQGASTKFALHEVFTGPMAGVIRKSMPDLQPSFDQFADALKRLSEERAS